MAVLKGERGKSEAPGALAKSANGGRLCRRATDRREAENGHKAPLVGTFIRPSAAEKVRRVVEPYKCTDVLMLSMARALLPTRLCSPDEIG